jgi:uroporphyrinogen III methyltransferase/synthase
LAGAQVAAVGEQTARALAQHGIRADCTNPGGNAESLAKQLLDKVQGRAVLLVRADRGREVLAQSLQPVCRLAQWTAYRQVNRLALNATEQAWLDEGPLDAVLLTSGNIASALAEVLPPHQVEAIRAGKTAVYSLSPVTSESIKKLGWPIAGEAKEPSMAQLAEVVQKGLASS